MTLTMNWELDSIFSGGGSQAPALAEFLHSLTADLSAFKVARWPESLTASTRPAWIEAIQTLYDLQARLGQTASFVDCLVAQDVKDEHALQLMAQVDDLGSQINALWTQLSAAAAQQPDPAWQQLVDTAPLKAVAFHLNEQRELARQKMSPELETLATELATHGYHAWNRLYGVVSGDKEMNWEGKTISLGQLQNKFMDDPDRSVRQAAFELYESAWQDLAKVCAEALNQQAGFRLVLYRQRGWDSVLHEPLLNNRLTRESLAAMWAVVDAKSAKLLDYFAAKARLFSLSRSKISSGDGSHAADDRRRPEGGRAWEPALPQKLSWFDLYAPVGEITTPLSYQTAADFVVDNFQRFNPHLADFARLALDRRWIEAEDRPGKRAGGFCTGFPLSKETRIFMTFNNSFNSMLTLAHELGHGYHDWVLRDLPYGAQFYSMGVAETASTFNELVVRQAGYEAAPDERQRLSLLGLKLKDAAAFLMDIRARFDFELAFFEQRAKKHLSVAELSELMLSAQKTAFKDGLDRYHPLFWASKLHFYITQAPFYNFPYTFGYLFSHGVYAQAIADGPAFHEHYVALLRDTGSMTTEELARTHLGVDLTRPEFWETAVDRVLADVDEFTMLVDKLG
ncbi:MAG: M3 family oligoendopeptidase [Chloroflexota bacterium]